MHILELDLLPPTQTHQSRLRAYRIGSFCRLIKVAADERTKRLQDRIKLELVRRKRSGKALYPDGPICLGIEFTFPWPQGTAKRTKDLIVPRVSRPDLDNMAKSVIDALTDGGAWSDDSQVTHLRLAKFSGPKPKVRIIIFPHAFHQ